MLNNILLVGTGGTIACAEKEKIGLDRPFKILDYCKYDNVNFDCVSPFFALSENMNFDMWQRLYDCINSVDFGKYKGVIVLHGSDTLSFTLSFLGNAFYDKSIIVTASDKPLEDNTANGFENFDIAVKAILNGVDKVYASYNGLYRAEVNPPLSNPVFNPKNILVIMPCVNIDYGNYNLDSVDAVLHTMYHSATAPQNVSEFVDKCRNMGIPFYFITENSSAKYESSKDFENIIFNSTLESAYARLLLTK